MRFWFRAESEPEITARLEFLLAMHADREAPGYWSCNAHGNGLSCCLDALTDADAWADLMRSLGRPTETP